jgi:hypothetical protein
MNSHARSHFALLAVLSGAEQLTAQTLRYKLIDLGTLGGGEQC